MKKRMKKCLSLVLAGAMAGMLATGCGANGGKEGTAAGDGSETAGTAKETGISDAAEQKAGGETAGGEKTKLVLWMPPFGTEESLDKEVWGEILKPFDRNFRGAGA